MVSGELTVSAGALTRVLVLFLYAPICLVAFRLLLPRLPRSTRLLAIAMMAAQFVMLTVALEDTPRWELKGWLWHLDQEWNIPSTFASMQLALVSGAALAAALLAGARQARYRFYLLAIALFFVYLAWDEYFSLHETNLALETVYIALGAVIAAATLAAAARSPRHARVWYVCLLAGMALNVTGAMVVDARYQICGSFGFIQLDGCLRVYNLEEAVELIAVWLILVAILGILKEATPKPRRSVSLFLIVLPILWIILLTRDAWLPRLELRLLAQPASIQIESEARLLGYHAEWDSESIVLRLYPSAWRSHYRGLGLSVHLVDQASKESVASRDIYTHSQARLLLAPSYAHVYRRQLEVEIPPATPTNRAYWIALSFWRKEGEAFVGQKILESDHQLLSETQVILGELALPAATPAISAAPLAIFDDALTLGAVDLPPSARLGETLNLSFAWRADAAGADDYVQFLHLGHVETGEWRAFDQQPLGPRLPTRLWYSGLADTEVWALPLPTDLAAGEYAVYTGLYRVSNQERVLVKSSDGTPLPDARVPLGFLTLE